MCPSSFTPESNGLTASLGCSQALGSSADELIFESGVLKQKHISKMQDIGPRGLKFETTALIVIIFFIEVGAIPET